MKKLIQNILLLVAAAVAMSACNKFDDTDLRDRIDDFKKRIEALQQKADALEEQLKDLGALTNGNVITSVTQNSDGKYVVTYKDDEDNEHAVVIATMEDLIDVPVLGVALDEEEGVYYWTQTVDGTTDWLCREGGVRLPVRGNTPLLSVDADGYWTVDGERIEDAQGNPIAANDDRSSVFKSASWEGGVFTVTLGNGEVLTFKVFDTLNLKLQTTASVTIVDAEAGYEIAYEVSGEAADKAVVAVASAAGGAEAVLDREAQKVKVTFDGEFTAQSNARVIIMAYDLAENVVVKPVFFKPAATNRIEIATAAQLVQFAADVNGGGIPEGMQIYLTDDIDMKDVKDWTPIGNGTFNASAITGAKFSGTFDGQGHKVDNLVVEVASAPANAALGLFGCVENATVKNVVIGEGSKFTATSGGMLHVGAVAAGVVASTIENCDNYASIHVEAGVKNQRISAGGIVGGAYTGENNVVIRNCRNFASMSSVNTISDNNGATGIQFGGILGFAEGPAGEFTTTVEKCENHGEFTAQAGRLGGVAASLNRLAVIRECLNTANLTNTDETASNCRTAGISAFMTNGSVIENCVNRGDITYAVAGSSKGYAAGIIGQMQLAETYVRGCENYGTVRSDIIKAADHYIGIIAANNNNSAVEISGCKVGGKIGPYTEDGDWKMVTITEDNFEDYVYFYKTTASPNVKDNVFAESDDDDDSKGIKTVADLLAFRDAVNAGTSTEEWQDENGVVNLLADLDLASAGAWTPIGNAAVATASNISTVTVSGNAFDGKFDGNGHSLTNIDLTLAYEGAEAAYGLFGVLSGADVRNIVLGAETGDKSALNVTSHSAIWAGTLAGAVIKSTVADCTSYIPMSYDCVSYSSSDKHGRGAVAMIALIHDSSLVEECNNHGDVTTTLHGSTENGLGTAIHVGGVAGVASSASADTANSIAYCSNYGDLTTDSGRAAGLVCVANNNTALNSCTNYGTQVNSIGSNGRLGGITALTNGTCPMIDCVNYGDLVSTSADGARCGGLVSLPNAAGCSFSGCANYGKIISNSEYRGVFWGYSTVAATWFNCIAGGICGVYNGGDYIYDSYPVEEQYLGPTGGTKPSLSNITYLIGTSEGEGGGSWQGPEAELKILCIGNSFTKDAVEHLPKMIAAAGIKTVKIMHMYYGGRTVPEYNDGYNTVSDYTCYMLNTDSDVWVSSKGLTLHQAAKSDNWDIVTIQEHTGNYRAWTWTDAEKAAIQGLIDNVKADQTGSTPKFCYIMSQAYFDMGKIGSGSQPYITWTDQSGMFDVITTQGKKVLAETDIDEVIPTGTALQNLRTSELDNEMNLTRDGYHMDYGISRFAAAATVFEMLITPKYGVTLDDNSFRYTTSNTADGSYSTPVTDDNFGIALAAARYAIANPFGVTDMSGANPSAPGSGIDDLPFENDTDKE